MSFETPVDARTARRRAIWGWVSFALVALLVATLAYLGYVGFVGSEQVTEPVGPSRDCRTPALAHGWSYEAINYDPAADAALSDLDDPTDCPPPQQVSGTDLITSDGVSLAGWYIPGGSGMDATGPTVVLAHGHGTNKSAMLDHAALLHGDYNLVLFDFRNHGQSEDAATTVGVRERLDVRAVIDWLEEHKAPQAIGLLGVSMGAAAAINEARADSRIRAVVIDSTHATVANALQVRLERAGFPLSLPGAWSILLGGLLRTGEDMSSADPLQTVERYGERPLLIVAGGGDGSIGSTDTDDLLDAATEAGAEVQLHVCDAAGHGQPVDACADEYGDWVLGFLERALRADS